MQRMIFVNLPVKNLDRAMAFYAGLGFKFNETFSDDSGAYVEIESNIALMLLTEDRFRGFIKDDIADTARVREALICLSAESRDAVSAMKTRALKHGGADYMPEQVHGDAMYGVSFTDPDGHVIEVMWMDVAAMSAQTEDAA